MKKIALLLALLGAFSFSAFAQDAAKPGDKPADTKKTEVKKTKKTKKAKTAKAKTAAEKPADMAAPAAK
jgi:hypothetical protein